MPVELILPDWPAPANVRALMTTRALGDVKDEGARQRLRALLPGGPLWLKQVHGARVVDAVLTLGGVEADASFSRQRNVVCAVTVADCMPVLLAEERGEVVGIAHAGWRGLAGGVIEATVRAMGVPPARLLAWLGPAIGPGAYEIDARVRDAFLAGGRPAQSAFKPTRPGHWTLDLYAAARQRLADLGVARTFGGKYCTASDSSLFYSYRRDKTAQRMAAVIWLD